MSQAETRIVPVGENGDIVPHVPAVPVQKVQTKYSTAMAVQIPRDIRTVERRALEEAAMLGADAFYAWGQGKDRIEGPSKELAMALVRIYGNCAVDMAEVQETRDAWIFTASFVDLETGFTLTRQFRQAKQWQVFGRFDDARKDDIRFQIGQSKAVRNVVLNAVPGWLVNRALDKAKGDIRGKIEAAIAQHGAEKVIDAALKKLAALGVPEARVLSAMGRQLPGALTVEDLVILAGNASALEAKAETVDDLFPVKAAPDNPAPATGSRTDALAEKLKNQNTTQGGPPAEGKPAEPATTETGPTTSAAEAGNGQKAMSDDDVADIAAQMDAVRGKAGQGTLIPDEPTNKPRRAGR